MAVVIALRAPTWSPMPRLAVPAAAKTLRRAEFLCTTMRQLFLIQAFLIALVGAVHIAALQLHLYWFFPWLDVPVHFFGGMWVVLTAVWLFTAAHTKAPFGIVVCILIMISIGWELFELWGGIPREANFAFDTSLDLLMDALGGFLGYAIAKRLIARDTIGSHGSP